MMRKAILFILTITMMVSCAEQKDFDLASVQDVETEEANMKEKERIDDFMTKARWGDGDAYLKLADCYINGKGVKKDFLGSMTMLTLACDYGGISDVYTYIQQLSEDNSIKMVFDVLDKITECEPDTMMKMADMLIEKGYPDGYAVKSLVYMGMNDSVNVMKMASIAAGQDNSLGKMILLLQPSMFYDSNADDEQIIKLGEEMPIVYGIIANKLAYYAYDDPRCKIRTAKYYMKADENGVISPNGARWLINYLEEGGDLHLSETDFQRLKKMSESDNQTPYPYADPSDNSMALCEKDVPDDVTNNTAATDTINDATSEREIPNSETKDMEK